MFQHSQFVQQQKKFYKEIRCVVCPALGNEKVYFNNKGFNHLLRKTGLPRPIPEQIARLRLLIFCKTILKDPTLIATHRVIKSNKGNVEFWGIEKKVHNLTIRIVICKINKGMTHFFSIYSL